MLDLACRTALSNRVPVHLAFPIDYQSADAEDLMRYKPNVPARTTTAYAAPVRTPPEAELRRAAEVLRGCSRPAILAGQGARGAREQLAEVSELLSAPIAKASRAVHIDDPETCGEQLRAALATPGPVVVEAVVDANEPPLPAKISTEQAKPMYDALRRGEQSRTRIGLTIGRQLVHERNEPASPYGVLARVKEKLGR